MNTKEELLQDLAYSLLRDFFAAAALSGLLANGYQGDSASNAAFSQARSMMRLSSTIDLIKKIDALKE